MADRDLKEDCSFFLSMTISQLAALILNLGEQIQWQQNVFTNIKTTKLIKSR